MIRILDRRSTAARFGSRGSGGSASDARSCHVRRGDFAAQTGAGWDADEDLLAATGAELAGAEGLQARGRRLGQ